MNVYESFIEVDDTSNEMSLDVSGIIAYINETTAKFEMDAEKLNNIYAFVSKGVEHDESVSMEDPSYTNALVDVTNLLSEELGLEGVKEKFAAFSKKAWEVLKTIFLLPYKLYKTISKYIRKLIKNFKSVRGGDENVEEFAHDIVKDKLKPNTRLVFDLKGHNEEEILKLLPEFEGRTFTKHIHEDVVNTITGISGENTLQDLFKGNLEDIIKNFYNREALFLTSSLAMKDYIALTKEKDEEILSYCESKCNKSRALIDSDPDESAKIIKSMIHPLGIDKSLHVNQINKELFYTNGIKEDETRAFYPESGYVGPILVRNGDSSTVGLFKNYKDIFKEIIDFLLNEADFDENGLRYITFKTKDILDLEDYSDKIEESRKKTFEVMDELLKILDHNFDYKAAEEFFDKLKTYGDGVLESEFYNTFIKNITSGLALRNAIMLTWITEVSKNYDTVSKLANLKGWLVANSLT